MKSILHMLWSEALMGTTSLAMLTSLALGFPNEFERSTPIAHPYYPLQVGSQWMYRLERGQMKVRVVAKRKIDDIDAFVVETTAFGSVPVTELIGVTRNGVFRFGFNDEKLDFPLMLIRLNPKNGDRWTLDSKVLLTEAKKIALESRIKAIHDRMPIGEAESKELEAITMELREGGQSIKGLFTTGIAKVTVPFGTFDTMHVKSAAALVGGTAYAIDNWYAKNVGLVKVKWSEGNMQLELQEYKPGK